MGWAYFSRIGLPSLMSTTFHNDDNHDFQPYEQDANRRAFMYFNKNVKGFYQTEAQYEYNKDNKIRIGWDFRDNPLDVYHTTSKNVYYDYYSSSDMSFVNSLSLRAKWYDYLDPLGLIVGIGNGLYYNKHRVK